MRMAICLVCYYTDHTVCAVPELVQSIADRFGLVSRVARGVGEDCCSAQLT